MSVAITGASGHFGSAAATHAARLLGGAGDLVLTTRSPSSIPESLAGADVRYADFTDANSLAEAFAGVSRLLLISADDVQQRADWHRSAIDAARDAGVQHIIYTSMIEPDGGNPALIADSHLATERHLARSGVPHTILRCALYADFQAFEAAEALEAGEFRHNRGDGGCAYVAREDCAEVAAAVLVSGDEDTRIYDVTGSESLTAADLAALYGEFGGSEIAAVAVDDAALMGESTSRDADGHAQYGMALAVSLGRAIREGFFGGVSTVVRDFTGHEPRTVADLLREHMLRARQRTGNQSPHRPARPPSDIHLRERGVTSPQWR